MATPRKRASVMVYLKDDDEKQAVRDRAKYMDMDMTEYFMSLVKKDLKAHEKKLNKRSVPCER